MGFKKPSRSSILKATLVKFLINPNLSGRIMQIMQTSASRHLVIELKIGTHLTNQESLLHLDLTTAVILHQDVAKKLTTVQMETQEQSHILLPII